MSKCCVWKCIVSEGIFICLAGRTLCSFKYVLLTSIQTRIKYDINLLSNSSWNCGKSLSSYVGMLRNTQQHSYNGKSAVH